MFKYIEFVVIHINEIMKIEFINMELYVNHCLNPYIIKIPSFINSLSHVE